MEYTVWIVFIVAMLIVEASTVALITIWFAIGALGAIAAKALGAGFSLQVMVMLVLSAISLAAARPFIIKHRQNSTVATNVDSLIGKTAVVTEDIEEGKFAGIINVDGKEWSAKAEDGNTITAGTKVRIKSINGVKLIVEKTSV